MQDLRQIVDQARIHVAATANYELTMMYWHIGERINREVLDNQRAKYGKQIVSQVATQLQDAYRKEVVAISATTSSSYFAMIRLDFRRLSLGRTAKWIQWLPELLRSMNNSSKSRLVPSEISKRMEA